MEEKVKEQVAVITKTLHYFSVKGLNSSELEEQSIEIGKDYYDKAGRMVKSIRSLWPAQGTESEAWTYDDSGHLERYVHIIADSDLPEDHRYHYDDNGRTSEEELLYADGTKDRIRYQYNAEGQLIRKEILDDEGMNAGEEVFQYDDDGKLVLQQKTDDEGAVSEESVFAYDDAGRLSNEQESDMYGTQIINRKLSHDEQGRVVREEREENGMLFIVKKTYSDHFLVREVVEDASGKTVRAIDYQYEGERLVEEREDVYQEDAMISEQHFRRSYQYSFH